MAKNEKPETPRNNKTLLINKYRWLTNIITKKIQKIPNLVRQYHVSLIATQNFFRASIMGLHF